MKIFKQLPVLFILLCYNSSSYAEEAKKNCKSIAKAETGIKMFNRLKCKLGNDNTEGIGKKLKNIFKKEDND